MELQQTLKYVRFTKIQHTSLKDERFTKTDLSIERLKDERQGQTNHQMSLRVQVRQNVSKRLKARQMCVDDEYAISKKPPLLMAQDTQ